MVKQFIIMDQSRDTSKLLITIHEADRRPQTATNGIPCKLYLGTYLPTYNYYDILKFTHLWTIL